MHAISRADHRDALAGGPPGQMLKIEVAAGGAGIFGMHMQSGMKFHRIPLSPDQIRAAYTGRIVWTDSCSGARDGVDKSGHTPASESFLGSGLARAPILEFSGTAISFSCVRCIVRARQRSACLQEGLEARQDTRPPARDGFDEPGTVAFDRVGDREPRHIAVLIELVYAATIALGFQLGPELVAPFEHEPIRRINFQHLACVSD